MEEIYKKALNFFQKKQFKESKKLCKNILSNNPEEFKTIFLLIIIYFSEKNYLQAFKYVEIAIRIDPNNYDLYNKRAYLNRQFKKFEDALNDCEKSLHISLNVEGLCSQAITNDLIGKKEDAIKDFTKAIEIKPNIFELYFRRGAVFMQLKLFENALNDFQKAEKLNSNYDHLTGLIIQAKQNICEWNGLNKYLDQLKLKISQNKFAATPWSVLSMFDNIDLQKKTAEIFSKKIEKNKIIEKIIFDKSKNDNKIKVGYYSSDFNNHAVSRHLIALIENHDKDKFEIIGFYFGQKKNDNMIDRMKKNFHKFFHLYGKSNDEIVKLSRDLKIDIAIDLNGYTSSNRYEIFVKRCSPIQISFLGYPGTMGSKFIDYIISDRTIIPESLEKKYSENVLLLPNCFMPNDPKISIPNSKFTKEDFGLPKDSFILCSFNKNYKISPKIFNTWSNILKKTKNSYLWLNFANEPAKKNLTNYLESKSIENNRIIFSKPVQVYEDHLSRLGLADLYLDTFPFGAHSSCVTSIFCGLPVLTMQGETIASRICSSILKSINLDDLITNDYEQYESVAIDLINNPEKIKNNKNKIIEKIKTSTLFNDKLYALNFEKKLNYIYEKAIS